MIRIVTLLFILYFCNSGFAQQQVELFTDSLILEGRGLLTGRIHHYNKKGKLIIETPNGYKHYINPIHVQRIIIHSSQNAKYTEDWIEKDSVAAKPCHEIYAFRERGIYHVMSASVLPGISYHNETQWGVGLNYNIGYQWNRWIGAGLGISLENYAVTEGNGALVFPLYAEARGYFLKKNTTPYYALRAGYGFVTNDENTGVRDAKGGVRLHPAFGFRTGAREDANFAFDVGYVFQKIQWTRDFSFNQQDFQIQDIWYKRLCVRIGMIFKVVYRWMG